MNEKDKIYMLNWFKIILTKSKIILTKQLLANSDLRLINKTLRKLLIIKTDAHITSITAA